MEITNIKDSLEEEEILSVIAYSQYGPTQKSCGGWPKNTRGTPWLTPLAAGGRKLWRGLFCWPKGRQASLRSAPLPPIPNTGTEESDQN